MKKIIVIIIDNLCSSILMEADKKLKKEHPDAFFLFRNSSEANKQGSILKEDSLMIKVSNHQRAIGNRNVAYRIFQKIN